MCTWAPATEVAAHCAGERNGLRRRIHVIWGGGYISYEEEDTCLKLPLIAQANVTACGMHKCQKRPTIQTKQTYNHLTYLGPSACIPLYTHATPRSRWSGPASSTETPLFDGAPPAGSDSDTIYVQSGAKPSIPVCLNIYNKYIISISTQRQFFSILYFILSIHCTEWRKAIDPRLPVYI